MLYQKHRNPSQATQKKASGRYFKENQRQESSRRSPCFWSLTSFGRGRSRPLSWWEAESAGLFFPSAAAGVCPVVGFGSRKVCWLPQYWQVKMSASAENSVLPPHEGQSSVMISIIQLFSPAYHGEFSILGNLISWKRSCACKFVNHSQIYYLILPPRNRWLPSPTTPQMLSHADQKAAHMV